MTLRVAVPVLAASLAILLAGCTPAPPVPAGPTIAEVAALVDEQHAVWWEQMSPGEPRPEVEPVLFVEPEAQFRHVAECVAAQKIEGVTVSDDHIEFNEENQHAFQVANYVCYLQYPAIITDPSSLGLMTDVQADYLYDYYVHRLVPCLAFLGIATSDPPRGRTINEGGRSSWYPYFDLVPMPVSAAEWQRLDYRCPPPPFGGDMRPPVPSEGG